MGCWNKDTTNKVKCSSKTQAQQRGAARWDEEQGCTSCMMQRPSLCKAAERNLERTSSQPEGTGLRLPREGGDVTNGTSGFGPDECRAGGRKRRWLPNAASALS